MVQMEVIIHQRLKHPNIIQLFGVVQWNGQAVQCSTLIYCRLHLLAHGIGCKLPLRCNCWKCCERKSCTPILHWIDPRRRVPALCWCGSPRHQSGKFAHQPRWKFIAPKFVGAVRQTMAIAAEWICAKKGGEINGKYWSYGVHAVVEGSAAARNGTSRRHGSSGTSRRHGSRQAKGIDRWFLL